ncbi:MAG: flagellar motor protein [Oleispira antarctica]|uniref:Flagellar motor protein n=1 Tax=Oleispira antarctica RB-8 TaxID=698738 RepID=R4YLB4_OLEAN|nr:flagellar motor protein [Oleispira antarctica]MBQ0790919.1 flagellar motor protein [Oleispira antarctica]CCK75422.1 Flagellar motor protein [Oleispira antarctica RB-8]
MDRLVLLLLFGAVSSVVVGHVLEGGSLLSLWNAPALLIVFGGSLLALAVQTPMYLAVRSLKLLSWLVAPPQFSLDQLLTKLTTCGNAYRKDGVLGLDRIAQAEIDPVMKRALVMLADGQSLSSIEKSIHLEIETHQEKDLYAAEVFDNLGGYLPTLGIVGAVLGLMQVLSNLAQPEELGRGIATAFVATFYGVAAANLIAIPIAGRLRGFIQQRTRYHKAMIVGVMAIREGVNPQLIRYRLEGIDL